MATTSPRPAGRSRRPVRRRWVAGSVGTSLTLAVVSLAGAATAATTAGTVPAEWDRTPVPVRYGGLSAVALAGGATVSVGFGIADPFVFTPLAVSWDGDSWDRQRVRVGEATDVQLTDVDLLSGTRGWAVGRWFSDSGAEPIAVRWNGSAWREVSTDQLPVNSGLAGVAAVARNDVWAVGQQQIGLKLRPVIAHYDGVAWVSVEVPPLDEGPVTALSSISAESSDRLWAVGASGVCLTYDGEAWTQVQLPRFAGRPIELSKVRSFGPDDTWAVGYVSGPDGRHPAALHWDGTAWSRVQTPVDDLAQLNDVSRTADGVVAIGYAESDVLEFYGLELDADGPASPLELPPGRDALFGSATSATGTELWVVGSGAVGTEGKIRPYAAVRR